MGKEETATEIPEVVENGTNALEKCSKVVTEKKEKESSELKSMDEDKVDSEKAETEKMDEDPKLNEEKESKEEKGNEEPITEVEEEKTELIKEETGSKGDAEVEGNEESKELEEKVDRSEEKEEKTEQNEDKGVKKRGRGRSSGEKKVVREKGEKKEPEPRTPASDRPQRERKSVERLVATVEKDATKEFHIEKVLCLFFHYVSSFIFLVNFMCIFHGYLNLYVASFGNCRVLVPH